MSDASGPNIYTVDLDRLNADDLANLAEVVRAGTAKDAVEAVSHLVNSGGNVLPEGFSLERYSVDGDPDSYAIETSAESYPYVHLRSQMSDWYKLLDEDEYTDMYRAAVAVSG